MDPSRFDTVARHLGYRQPRRPLLALAGAVLAGIGISATPSPDAAGKGKRRCLKNGTRCTFNSGVAGDNCSRCCSGASKRRRAGGRRCTCQATGGACQANKDCCNRDCANNICAVPVLTCGSGGPCRAFRSSESYQGNLGGVLGADAKCQTLADAAGLGGTYIAWISDDGNGFPANRFVQSTTPYVLVEGTQIAANWTALTSGTLDNALSRDEYGVVRDFRAWTDTTADGTPQRYNSNPPRDNCDGWTSNSGDNSGGYYGQADRTDQLWTAGVQGTNNQLCSDSVPIYCFEQG